MALAGQCDDPRTRADRELDREHADAAAGPGDHDRLTCGRGHGAHGGDPGHAGDEQRTRHLPRDLRRLRRQVGRLDEHVLGLAFAVVGIADHLVAHRDALHARAELLHHAGEVRALATGKGRGKDRADQALTHLPLAGIDPGGADRHEHLAGPGLRTWHLADVEDLDAAVVVESDGLGHRYAVTRSAPARCAERSRPALSSAAAASSSSAE